MIGKIALITFIQLCLQQGDVIFINISPLLEEWKIPPQELTATVDDFEMPILKGGLVPVAVGLKEEKRQVKIRLLGRGKSLFDTDLPVCDKKFPEEIITVSPDKVFLSEETLKRVKREQRLFDNLWLKCSEPITWDFPFQWPLPGYRAKDNFGLRRIFNGVPRSPHTGVDISAPEGTPVLAVSSGKVALTGDFFFAGKSVVIDHGGCLYSMYFHLSEILVNQGEKVNRGQPIGKVGATGRAKGPHLHFGFRLAGKRVHPFSFFTKAVISFRGF